MSSIPETKFAPSERVDSEIINQQKAMIENLNSIKPILDNIPVFILVLNKHRQIVFSNKTFLNLICNDNIYGMRPGECVNCIHANEEAGGCGTSEFCSQCGAVNAILNSQIKGFDVQECRITQIDNSVLDLNIWAKTIAIEGENFTLFSFIDISDEKRRKVLERIFFHDILNTAGSLKGFLDLVKDCPPNELEEYLNIAQNISAYIIEEIKSQRSLAQAEDGELILNKSHFSTKEILEEIVYMYENNLVLENRKIKIDNQCVDAVIYTDKPILRRVISNLAKNAVEATAKNNVVTLSCEIENETISFTVHNPEYIPQNIQLQLFQRSFSTKGPDRGIGTYSVKLLTEKYLKGTVSFSSEMDSGTIFSITFPKNS